MQSLYRSQGKCPGCPNAAHAGLTLAVSALNQRLNHSQLIPKTLDTVLVLDLIQWILIRCVDQTVPDLIDQEY